MTYVTGKAFQDDHLGKILKSVIGSNFCNIQLDSQSWMDGWMDGWMYKSNVKTKRANEGNQIFLSKNDPMAPRRFY